MHLSSHILTAISLFAIAVVSQSNTATIITSTLPSPTPTVLVKTTKFQGCYAVDKNLQVQYGYIFQTSGWCQKVCLALPNPAAVMGLGAGTYCYCGSNLPGSAKVDDSKCGTDCTGYDKEKCGGDRYWSVYGTGLKENLENSDSSDSDPSNSDAATSSSSPAAVVSTVTQGNSVITVTPASATSTNANSAGGGGGGSSITGIVAGVVVGIVLLAAIIGGIVFLMRHRRKKAIEEEHRRATASSELMASKRAQASSPFDARLEPVMLQKRQSDGSIADHQDYSRRILKVVNPDG